jgi:hypothetical protein
MPGDKRALSTVLWQQRLSVGERFVFVVAVI